MKKPAQQHLVAEALRRQSRVEMTIGIDLGDVWSHYCTLNEEGEVVDRSRFLREEIRLCSTSPVGPRTEDSITFQTKIVTCALRDSSLSGHKPRRSVDAVTWR